MGHGEPALRRTSPQRIEGRPAAENRGFIPVRPTPERWVDTASKRILTFGTMSPAPPALVFLLLALAVVAPAAAQTAAPAPVTPWQLSPAERQRLNQLTEEDHADMMVQLGIRELRSGRNGNPTPGDPHAANYDQAKANPFPDYPDPLLLRDGRKVTTPGMWWQLRRPEIVEDFEREVFGRVPAKAPSVTWKVQRTVQTEIAGVPVTAYAVVGHADNSACPSLAVDIRMAVVLPREAPGPVPVLMMFGWGNLPDEATPRWPGVVDPPVPPSTDQLIAAGWGYASIATASIQADNGAGLTQGIIGLANQGHRRRPDDWGALRAWAWGAGRGLDFLSTLPAVDPRHVGIEGVSRYGKAALVTMAFDQRFHFALVGSSGEGGAKPHRRNFGESVENLTSSGEYHWMAGNFLKYGAEQSAFGRRDASDLPVDSPELIALCAPRPTFISYGLPEKGDANWLDHQGSYMAAVAAGAVYRLLGARDLGVAEDYHTAQMPPQGTNLLSGDLAWRQHDGGHEDRSNMSYFTSWANGLLGRPAPTGPDGTASAAVPAARPDAASLQAHEQLLAKAHQGRIDVYFLGDSITRRWGATDYPAFLANWNRNFHGWNAADFGWGADQIQNMLWRVQYGELDGVSPKVIVLLAGTNNVGKEPADDAKVADITRGLGALLALCQRKAPGATIILTAIFPRNDSPGVMPTINRINAGLAKLADGRRVRFLDVNGRLADGSGQLYAGMTLDLLHPTLKGYQAWADGLRPILTELLGPPAADDLATPPTGDPSAPAAVP